MAYATYYEKNEYTGEYKIHFKMGDVIHVFSCDEAQIFLRSGLETLLAASQQMRCENAGGPTMRAPDASPCPAGGEHSYSDEPGQIYTGSCLKCGKRR